MKAGWRYGVRTWGGAGTRSFRAGGQGWAGPQVVTTGTSGCRSPASRGISVTVPLVCGQFTISLRPVVVFVQPFVTVRCLHNESYR